MSTQPVAGDRGRRLEHQERAYELQKKGAVEGMIKYTIYSSLVVTLGHLTWPAFRRQAIGLKAFIISSSTIAGLVFGAEKYLLRFESQQRESENDMRRQARNDLARQGIIATETEIKKWKTQRDDREKAKVAQESG